MGERGHFNFALTNEKPVVDKKGMRLYRSIEKRNFLQNLISFFHLLTHFKIVKDLKETVRTTRDPIEKIGCMFSDLNEHKKAMDLLRARGDLEVVTTRGNDLEITAKGTTKGAALKSLYKKLNLSREQVIAFGDSGNDISMIDVVANFMAPKNASEDVLSAASQIIPGVTEDGVAVFLEEMLV